MSQTEALATLMEVRSNANANVHIQAKNATKKTIISRLLKTESKIKSLAETNEISSEEATISVIDTSSIVPTTSIAEGKRQVTSFTDRTFNEIFDNFQLTSIETMDTIFDLDVANEELNSTSDVNATIITIDSMDITFTNTVEPGNNHKC
ncbi:hypothetical protein TNCV_1607831 [Trichonephila clavipes]|nr:hypothetical protein TNCV_1607831 [Trichonephila clavipes]